MSLNTTPKSDSGSPSLPSRLASALVGGGFAWLAASNIAVAAPFALFIALAVAAIGLAAPKVLLLPAAAVLVPSYRLGKYLSGEAYRGFARGLLNFLIGLPASIAAAVSTATYVGWAHDLSLLIWFPAACVAFLATLFIIEPAAFLYILKPTGDGLEKLWKATRELATKHAKPFFQGLVDAARKLPGSNSLWTWVENKEKGAQWVDGFVGFLTAVGVLGFTSLTAYTVFHFAAPYAALISSGWVMTGIAGFAAGVVAIAIVGVLFQLLDKGQTPFAATALTGAGVYAALPLSKALGLGLAGTIGVGAVEFVLGLAYVYPAVHGILKSGLIKTIIEGVRKLVEKTYREQDADYRKFVGTVLTPVCALISGGLAFWALSFYGLPLLVVAPAVLLVTFLTYVGVGEGYDDFESALTCGGILSAATGFALWFFFAAAVSPWFFYPLAVIAIAFTFAVIVPVIYLGVRAVAFPIAKPVGSALGAVNKKAYNATREVCKWWNTSVIDKTYTDETSAYAKGFVHVFNLAVVGLGVWKALPLTAGWLGMPGWLVTSGLVASAGLLYLLVGRALEKTGPIAAGFAVALGTFSAGIWALYQVAPSHWWLAAIVSAAATSAIFYVVTPAVLLVIKKLLGWLVEPLGTHVLTPVFEFAWKRFEFVWNAFLVVAKFVNTWLLTPALQFVAAIIKAIGDVWSSMFGRK